MPRLAAVAAFAAALAAPQVHSQVTLYSDQGYRGASYAINWDMPNLDPYGFNDRTASVIVDRGRWEFCADQNFEGRCTVLTPGQYPSLASMGLDRSISSIRRVGGNVPGGHPPAPPPNYNYYPRYGEPIYQADVIHVRAVGGAVVGSNVAGGRPGTVQKCSTDYSGDPAYYDVTYRFRGRDYTAQLGFAPGPTIPVNGKGEPRV